MYVLNKQTNQNGTCWFYIRYFLVRKFEKEVACDLDAEMEKETSRYSLFFFHNDSLNHIAYLYTILSFLSLSYYITTPSLAPLLLIPIPSRARCVG